VRLFPRNDRYFEFFDAAGREADEVVESFAKVAAGGDNISLHAGDLVAHHGGRHGVTHLVMQELEGAFITPFDREDILALAYAVDDAIDGIVGAADVIAGDDVGSPPEGFADLAELICQAGSCVAGGMRGLRELKTISFGRLSSEVAGLAKRGAQLERRIMAELFRFKGEHATRRALQWQRAVDSSGEVLRHLREAARALETTVVKYS